MITKTKTPQFTLAVNEVVEEVTTDVDGFTEVKNSAGKKGLVLTENLGKGFFLLFLPSISADSSIEEFKNKQELNNKIDGGKNKMILK